MIAVITWINRRYFFLMTSIHCVKASVFGVSLVRIFQHSDWIRGDTFYLQFSDQENTVQKNSEYGHFLRSGWDIGWLRCHYVQSMQLNMHDHACISSIVPGSRFIRITNFSDHRKVWNTSDMQQQLPNPLSQWNLFIHYSSIAWKVTVFGVFLFFLLFNLFHADK